MAYVKYVAKALFAGVTAGLGALAAVLVGDSASFSNVTAGQWVTIVLATLVAAGGVFGLTNGAKPS